ncbi:hypothetical protein BCD_0887 (plasmid) [Borrelia crocidurae DOU]|uniref:Uncharacterized protein n=1 Tax=Borrelia crocidurae DOU TaxID=1293575 RepID=W5SJY2_9SPIR|nr:hypothetical protein [Borrelia crocidurae]AHH06953.1 hypothetical protein BCD_0887 [Borrelia crocidurae DOU]
MVYQESTSKNSPIYAHYKEGYYREVVKQMKSEFQDKNSYRYKESLAKWKD